MFFICKLMFLTSMPEPVRPIKPNGIRMRSTVFPNALDRQTDRPTDRSRESLTRPLRYNSDAA